MMFRSICLAFVTAFAFLLMPASAAAQETVELPARVTDYALTEAPDDHAMGSDDAALTMIIWASVTCPHCGKWFSEEWPTVKTELVETGKLRVVFREFPTSPEDMVMTGFQLAECAPTEDYMSIIEFQMEQQNALFKAREAGLAREAYTDIAKKAGMETNEAITTCFRNPDITTHIIDNANRAFTAGIKSVPSFLINGERYKGASDAKSLVALIDRMDEKGVSSLPKDIKPVDAHAGHDHN